MPPNKPAGCPSTVVMLSKHVPVLFSKNDDQAPWVCVIRGVSSNTRCVGYFACRSELSYLAQVCLHFDLKKGEKEGKKEKRSNQCEKQLTSWALSRNTLLLDIHRDHKDYEGQGVQGGHLDFHSSWALIWLKVRGHLIQSKVKNNNLINNSTCHTLLFVGKWIGKEIDKLSGRQELER